MKELYLVELYEEVLKRFENVKLSRDYIQIVNNNITIYIRYSDSGNDHIPKIVKTIDNKSEIIDYNNFLDSYPIIRDDVSLLDSLD
jgi:hypothetical protein